MKTGKIIMFTSLWALGIASLFLMGSSNASFNVTSQRWNNIQSMAEVESYADLLEKIEWTKMEWKITEEKFNEMKEKQENREQNKEAIDAAIQNHDFSAWTELHEWQDILDNIDTEAKFEKLIEMQGILEDARTNMEDAREEAAAIAEELWIERWMGEKMGWKMWGWNEMGMWNREKEGNKMWMRWWNHQERWTETISE